MDLLFINLKCTQKIIKTNNKPTNMPSAGFEPQTLGAASSDRDQTLLNLT